MLGSHRSCLAGLAGRTDRDKGLQGLQDLQEPVLPEVEVELSEEVPGLEDTGRTGLVGTGRGREGGDCRTVLLLGEQGDHWSSLEGRGRSLQEKVMRQPGYLGVQLDLQLEDPDLQADLQ